MPFWSAEGHHQYNNFTQNKKIELSHTLLDHLLDGTCGVDLHSGKIVKAINLGCVLGELLAKRIG
jgi:hypothetical protein